MIASLHHATLQAAAGTRKGDKVASSSYNNHARSKTSADLSQLGTRQSSDLCAIVFRNVPPGGCVDYCVLLCGLTARLFKHITRASARQSCGDSHGMSI